MSSADLNMSYANFGELSPINNSGEYSFDVNYLPSSHGESIESSYNAGFEYIPAFNEQVPDLGLDVYSDNYLGYDGSQVVPVYYPIPIYYQIYNGVSAVESNGTTYYNYYPFAVPMYGLSSELTAESIISSDVSTVSYPDDFTNEIFENFNDDSISPGLTTENILTSDVTSVSQPDDFSNEIFENVNEYSYSDHFTPSSENGDDVADNRPPEELIDVSEYYDEAFYSDQFTPSSDNGDNVADNGPPEELIDVSEYYDEALKLSVKDHIPEVHVMPEILEGAEGVEISQEILESEESFEKVSWTDVIPEIDKSVGDQKNPNDDEIESSYANGAHKEKCQASREEYDPWKDFFCTIDDPVFGIEACFNNASDKESSYNDLDKKNFTGSPTCGKTFMILTRLNKQIQILPTIEEEEEPVVESENLHAMVQKTPVEINKEIPTDLEEGCFKSKQRNAEKVENNRGLPEATVEVGTSEKPKKKKRFKRVRRFFSELRSCFRKSESPPG